MTLTVGSLFAGIGGFDLGLERAGMEVRWQVELDPYCQRVLAKHWPDVPRYGDIKEVDPTEIEPVDLICGGFPCQPVSIAGKRQAEADDRWLWPEFAGVVRGVRPRYVLIENVPGLLSASGGRAAQAVLGDLAELGYDAEWACVPAAAVGAPHLRYRTFVVANSDNHRRTERRLPEGQGGRDLPNSARCGGIGCDSARQEDRGLGSSPLLITGRPSGAWLPEPDVGRVAHGVSHRVDRLRALGNAVVPQVAEWVGRRIVAAEETRHQAEAA